MNEFMKFKKVKKRDIDKLYVYVNDTKEEKMLFYVFVRRNFL